MDVLVALNSQTVGRDRIARVIQYASRFVWHTLNEKDFNKNTVDSLKRLEYILGTFRKLLRFGRCFDTLYTTLPVIHHPDPFIRTTVGLSKVSSSLFLFADHIIWLNRSGLLKVDSEKWTKTSNRYWLYSLILNLTRDLYEISKILRNDKHCFLKNDEPIKTINALLVAIWKALLHLRTHEAVFIDTIKNACDFWIPLTALGYTKLSPGTIGLLGMISSIAGFIVMVNPKAKLTPS